MFTPLIQSSSFILFFMYDHIPRLPTMNAVASHYKNSCDQPKNALFTPNYLKNEKRDWNLEKNNFYEISSSFEQVELA